jgi:hypothetical protein
VTNPAPAPTPAASGVDISQNEFWALSLADRDTAFAELRRLDSPPFFAIPENPFNTEDQGYYAFVKHADVLEASRHADIFSSARGATSLVDLPPDFNEYFARWSTWTTRHARRGSSRCLPPKMIKKFQTTQSAAAVRSTVCSRPAVRRREPGVGGLAKVIYDMMRSATKPRHGAEEHPALSWLAVTQSSWATTWTRPSARS